MAFAIEPALLDRAIAGDAAALNGLVTAVRPLVERQLLRYPVSEADRHDLLQATLMQVMRRLDSFRGDSSFSTWLFRVTANEALMLMRSQRSHRARLLEGLEFEDLGNLPATNDVVEQERSDTIVSNRERDAYVQKAVAQLPDDCRNLVIAHYLLDLGLQDIAIRLEITESAVRARLHRARGKLRTLLKATPVGIEMRAHRRRAAAGAHAETSRPSESRNRPRHSNRDAPPPSLQLN
ncbi:MAG: sigma-70 family RNA polymerase sigma factor [Myxococcales bacterium]